MYFGQTIINRYPLQDALKTGHQPMYTRLWQYMQQQNDAATQQLLTTHAEKQGYHAFDDALTSGQPKAVQFVFEHTPPAQHINLIKRSHTQDGNALHIIAQHAHCQLFTLLEQKINDPNQMKALILQKDANGYTVWHYAARNRVKHNEFYLLIASHLSDLTIEQTCEMALEQDAVGNFMLPYIFFLQYAIDIIDDSDNAFERFFNATTSCLCNAVAMPLSASPTDENAHTIINVLFPKLFQKMNQHQEGPKLYQQFIGNVTQYMQNYSVRQAFYFVISVIRNFHPQETALDTLLQAILTMPDKHKADAIEIINSIQIAPTVRQRCLHRLLANCSRPIYPLSRALISCAQEHKDQTSCCMLIEAGADVGWYKTYATGMPTIVQYLHNLLTQEKQLVSYITDLEQSLVSSYRLFGKKQEGQNCFSLTEKLNAAYALKAAIQHKKYIPRNDPTLGALVSIQATHMSVIADVQELRDIFLACFPEQVGELNQYTPANAPNP